MFHEPERGPTKKLSFTTVLNELVSFPVGNWYTRNFFNCRFGFVRGSRRCIHFFECVWVLCHYFFISWRYNWHALQTRTARKIRRKRCVLSFLLIYRVQPTTRADRRSSIGRNKVPTFFFLSSLTTIFW